MKRIVLVVVGLAVAFVLGLAVGQSLDDNSGSSGNQTIVRTLKPLALTPAARQTVTITVSNP